MSLFQDVERLKKAALPEVRESIASKVASYYCSGMFSEDESRLAEEIFRLLTKDAAVRVRQILSDNLKQQPNLPHDVALALANDIADIATPMLEYSKVLTDEDLIAIVQSTKEIAKQIAISRREFISGSLSGALVKTHHEEVIVSLLGNHGATIEGVAFDEIMTCFESTDSVINLLVDRGDLPIGVAEKLLLVVSDSMKERLTANLGTEHTAAVQKATEATKEQATIGLIEDGQVVISESERIIAKMSQLINHLFNEGRLTSSIVIRALCEGNVLFFEVAVSRLASVPTSNTRKIIRSSNQGDIESLCVKAGLPANLSQAITVLLEYALDEHKPKTASKREYKDNLIEYLTANGYDDNVPLMPYIMALIGSGLNTEDVVS